MRANDNGQCYNCVLYYYSGHRVTHLLQVTMEPLTGSSYFCTRWLELHAILPSIKYVQRSKTPITRTVYSGSTGSVVGFGVGSARITSLAVADIDS